MKIEEIKNDGFGILSIEGNLVLEEAVELKGMIKPYLEDSHYNGLVCNMEKVSHIDSSGLGIIISIYKSLISSGKRFALAGLNSRNAELFNISKLDRIFTIAEDCETAVKILKSDIAQ